MKRELKIAATIFLVVFIIDQIVKYGFANFNLDVRWSLYVFKIGI